MTERPNQSKNVEIPLLSDESALPVTMSVEALLDRLKRVVTHTRSANPELAEYHLHDVTLKVTRGQLNAVLDFRR